MPPPTDNNARSEPFISRRPSLAFLRGSASSRDRIAEARAVALAAAAGSSSNNNNNNNNNSSNNTSTAKLVKKSPKKEATRGHSPRLPPSASHHALPDFSLLPSLPLASFALTSSNAAASSSSSFSIFIQDGTSSDALQFNPETRHNPEVVMEKQKMAPLSPLPSVVVYTPQYATPESITNRGRYNSTTSLAGSLDKSRRIRRKKDPTPLNVLVIGSKASGKTSFISFLQKSLARPSKLRGVVPATQPSSSKRNDGTSHFTSCYVETDHGGERLGITLFDSKALEKHIVDLQIRELSTFIESKFQETFNEEQKVMRTTGAKDTHIHCVFLLLDPSRLDGNIAISSSPLSQTPNGSLAPTARVIGGLDEDLDVAVINALQGKTTVIPVISKADTITTAHMAHLKRTMLENFKTIGFNPIQPLDLDAESDTETEDTNLNAADDGDDGTASVLGDTSVTTEAVKQSEDSEIIEGPVKNGIEAMKATDSEALFLPLSIMSPDVHEAEAIGRGFAWGFADPYNPEHCDFIKLKDIIFDEWEVELRSTSRVLWYETWRTNRLKKRGSPSNVARKVSNATVNGIAMSKARSTSGSASISGGGSRVVSSSTIGVTIDTPPASPETTHVAH